MKDLNSSSPNYGLCIAGAYTYDGIHQVGARVQSATGLAGADASMPVAVNRCAPIPPPAFSATERNTNTSVIDTEWQDNPEGDIVGYRVYKGTTPAGRIPVCPASVSGGQVIPVDAGDQCTDPSPPVYPNKKDPLPYYYGVYAVDRDSSGNLREGALSYADVNTGGTNPPNPPASFALTPGANVRLSWTLPSGTIDSFRVYRKDGTVTGTPTYLDRYDRDRPEALCSGTSCSYTDTGTGGTPHTYWVTAVDTNLRESSFVGPKSG